QADERLAWGGDCGPLRRLVRVVPNPMAHDPKQIEQLALAYTEAWCSRDPGRVAARYVPGGTIAINGGDATGIGEVAEAFIAAFPDIQVFMDELVLREDGTVEFRWTFTGTSAE